MSLKPDSDDEIIAPVASSTDGSTNRASLPVNKLFNTLANATRELFIYSLDEWDNSIDRSLRMLGNATGVDRVYLFQNDAIIEENTPSTSQRYEWNSGTAEAQINNQELQNLPYTEIEPLHEYLSAGKPYSSIVAEMPDKSFKRILQDEDILSILIFPIFVRNNFWGFIGFDECKYEREWTDIEYSVLRSFSATISAALETKTYQEALLESEQRFRILQQASFGGIGLHDNGIIIDCNQGLSAITGYTQEELIGMNGLDLVSKEYRDLVATHIANGYDKPYDVEGIRKDGTRYTLEIHAKSIPYKGKSIRVKEFRDVTERKRTELKIIEQNSRLAVIADDLKRKNDQLEEFTQIVSHNLRSPVGNIVSLLSLIEEAAPEEQRKLFEYLKESGSMMMLTLDELNEVLKIKQNKNIEKQELHFETVLNNITKMLHTEIMKSSATITADFSEAPILWYPAIYMESIFLNFISNALKYFNPAVPLEITIRTYQEEGHKILEITDNGLGINLDKYGHQLFKLRKTFHSHPESRGVGLFMVKNQVEAMGGTIKVSSKEEKGTTFTVIFATE